MGNVIALLKALFGIKNDNWSLGVRRATTLPTTLPGTQLTSGDPAGAGWGAYIVIQTAAANTAHKWLKNIMVNAKSVITDNADVQIALGEVGSEVNYVQITDSANAAADGRGASEFSDGYFCPSGVAINARCRCTTNVTTLRVKLTFETGRPHA